MHKILKFAFVEIWLQTKTSNLLQRVCCNDSMQHSITKKNIKKIESLNLHLKAPCCYCDLCSNGSHRWLKTKGDTLLKHMKIGVVIKITILCKKLANMEELVARQWLVATCLQKYASYNPYVLKNAKYCDLLMEKMIFSQ